MKDENRFDLLSRREMDVIDLLLKGKSNKQIALALGISERTVEFHLNNIYAKLQVASRVEAILLLSQPTGHIVHDLVESTVDEMDESIHNGNQPSRSRVAQSLRNTVSLIKQEVAMTLHISFEELENYLRGHPVVFSLLALIIASATTRYVVFDLGLYFWVSYLLLEFLLILGSVRLGELLNRKIQFRPLIVLVVAALLPLLAAGFDQLYVNTILRYTDPISISIVNVSTFAEWMKSADGEFHRSTSLSTTSDILWFMIIAEMLILFMLSRMLGSQYKRENAVV